MRKCDLVSFRDSGDFSLMLDDIQDGMLVTDAQGYILYISKSFCFNLEVDSKRWIGKHITEFDPNTRLPIVAKSGKPEFNKIHRFRGRTMLVHRFPIKKNGRVVAVCGQVIFKNIRHVIEVATYIDSSEWKIEKNDEEIHDLRFAHYTFDSILARNSSMISLKKRALKAASANFPVLITGESGTGKELFAHAIHSASIRRSNPFLRINCTTIPKDLFESELFGYARGAFTGADTSGKAGKFELVHRGSIFLDEIGDLPVEMQPKLLRVLDEKMFERVGGTSPIRSDFRLITATNQNLEELVREGRFRQDLFYRLNVIPLHIPPLRQRKEDIPVLINALLKELSEYVPSPQMEIDPLAVRTLCNYDWPGNIRELRNVLEQVIFFLEKPALQVCDLPSYIFRTPHPSRNFENSTLAELLAETEKQAIKETLQLTGYNKDHTAKALGIHRTHLYKKMKKHQLNDLRGIQDDR